MCDVFISHSSKDAETAKKLQTQLQAKGANAFVAGSSLAPGEKWSPEIKENLSKAEWVLFLATKDGCASPTANQEVGGSWLAGKQIVPIMSGVRPEELPGWTKEYQAVDLDAEPERVEGVFNRIADFLERKRFVDWLIGGLLLAALIWLLVKVFKPAWIIGCLLLFGLVWLAFKPIQRSASTS